MTLIQEGCHHLQHYHHDRQAKQNSLMLVKKLPHTSISSQANLHAAGEMARGGHHESITVAGILAQTAGLKQYHAKGSCPSSKACCEETMDTSKCKSSNLAHTLGKQPLSFNRKGIQSICIRPQTSVLNAAAACTTIVSAKSNCHSNYLDGSFSGFFGRPKVSDNTG